MTFRGVKIALSLFVILALLAIYTRREIYFMFDYEIVVMVRPTYVFNR